MAKYFPVLKTKQAEFNALDRFEHWVDGATPVFEVIPPPIRKVKLEEHGWYLEMASKLLPYAAKGTILVDGHFMSVSEDDCSASKFYTWLADLVAESPNDLKVVPVVGVESGVEEVSAASKLSSAAGAGVAVRISASEIGAAGRDSGDSLNSRLTVMLKNLSISRARSLLLIDLAQIESESDLYLNSLAMVLPRIVSEWQHVILLGTSAPENNAVARFEQSESQRIELDLWREVSNLHELGRPIDFGDYVGFAAGLPSGQGRTRHPSLRYTTESVAYLVRRQATVGEGFSVFKDICTHVVGQDWFAGAEYSWGDGRIAQTASGVVKAAGGGAIGWRAISVNHHMTLTMAQVSNHL